MRNTSNSFPAYLLPPNSWRPARGLVLPLSAAISCLPTLHLPCDNRFSPFSLFRLFPTLRCHRVDRGVGVLLNALVPRFSTKGFGFALLTICPQRFLLKCLSGPPHGDLCFSCSRHFPSMKVNLFCFPVAVLGQFFPGFPCQ